MIQYSFLLEGELSKRINDLSQKRKSALAKHIKSHPIASFFAPAKHNTSAITSYMATPTTTKDIKKQTLQRLRSLRAFGDYEGARKLKQKLIDDMPKEFKLKRHM